MPRMPLLRTTRLPISIGWDWTHYGLMVITKTATIMKAIGLNNQTGIPMNYDEVMDWFMTIIPMAAIPWGIWPGKLVFQPGLTLVPETSISTWTILTRLALIFIPATVPVR